MKMSNNYLSDVQSDNEAAAPPSPSQLLKVFPWEQLPVEIRDQIFDNLEDESLYGSYFEWNGSVPALVIALHHCHCLMSRSCRDLPSTAPRSK
jgi:hypothetical protein